MKNLKAASAGLTRRLLIVCIGLYILVAGAVTLFEVTEVSVQSQADSDRQINSLSETFRPALVLALWNYNNDQLEVLLGAMANVPAVGRLRLITTEGGVIERPVRRGPPVQGSLGPVHSYPLIRTTAAKTEKLGDLEIEPSLVATQALVQATIWMGFFRTSVLVLLLSIVLVLAAGRLVGRPLRNLTTQIRSLDPASAASLSPDPRAGTELAQVADAFNTLLGQLRGAIEGLRDREREILLLNSSLESKVAARTRDLDQRNRDLEVANERLESTVLELENTRERLMESAKMAVLGQLVAGVAHELNTPLGAALSASRSALEILEEIREELVGDLGTSLGADTDLLRALFSRANLTGLTTGGRDLRLSLRQELREYVGEEADDMAEALVELGVVPPLGDLGPRLAASPGSEALATAQRFVALAGSCHVLSLASDKMAHVVDNLLGYARKEDSAALVPVELGPELETILRLFATSTKGGVKVLRMFEPVPPVSCKKDQIQQVWINLVSNAIQSMGGKGTLGIGLRKQGTGVEVRIEDDGPGIPPEIASKLFTPFVTSKPRGQGTGLGLTICRRIVEEHGGKIGFESVPGRTVFRVWLPGPEEPSRPA